MFVCLTPPNSLFQEEKREREIKQTIATISDLTPSTQYCVKVKALSEAYNKTSPFSNEECIKTSPGRNCVGLVMPVESKLLTVRKPLQVSLSRKYLQCDLMALPS